MHPMTLAAVDRVEGRAEISQGRTGDKMPTHAANMVAVVAILMAQMLDVGGVPEPRSHPRTQAA
jgi:hypothetical protein